jgi:hypothetical protein
LLALGETPSASCGWKTAAFTWKAAAGPATCPGCGGYDKVLIPMERASSLFHEQILARRVPSDDPRFRRALFHLLAAETSCYRYWARVSGPPTAPNCPVAPPTSSRSSDTRQGKDGHRQLLDQSSSSCVVGPRWWSAPG